MTTRTQYFPAGGGLDVVSPPLSITPGRALAMVNFEPWYSGGYRRIPGFERFDGRTKPSEITFMGFRIEDTTGLLVGDTLTGDTSGTTGEVVGIASYIISSDGVMIGVTKVSGSGFVNGEYLNSGARLIVSEPVLNSAPTAALQEDWLLVAEANYRADIIEVPGSGYALGAWQREDTVYAVRDNAGNTAGILHKASTAGWVTTGITMAEYLYFDAGLPAGPIAEGDTITGATSGATATVHKMILHSGGWSGSDATGYLVLTGVAGGPFQNNESLTVSATPMATADGINVAFAFAPDGDYRFLNHNFYGSSTSYRTYGCNGVNAAFEIDENHIVSPILLPQTAVEGQPANNTPFLIEEHRNYLFLAFPGGTFSHSVIGEPIQINGFLGAAEFGAGDELTGFSSVAGGVMVINSRRETRGLYGKDTNDWELKLLAKQGGGKLFATQTIDTTYALDNTGITSLARSDIFGDFLGSTVSELVQPIVNSLREYINDSSVVRESNQYRLYFSDKSVLVMYVPAPGSFNEKIGIQTRKGVEFGYLSYPIEVRRIFNCDDETGKEHAYFVSTDGYVYEDQVGNNFDGEVITSYLRLPFNHVGTPAYRKFFRRADLEISAQNALALKVAIDLSYGSAETSSGQTDLTTSDIDELTIFGAGGFWDSANWDEFNWDGQIVSTARVELTGTGENIGFLIFNQTAKAKPWIFQGLVLHYDVRRLQR